jgi:hypothetical protein
MICFGAHISRVWQPTTFCACRQSQGCTRIPQGLSASQSLCGPFERWTVSSVPVFKDLQLQQSYNRNWGPDRPISWRYQPTFSETLLAAIEHFRSNSLIPWCIVWIANEIVIWCMLMMVKLNHLHNFGLISTVSQELRNAEFWFVREVRRKRERSN